MRNHTGRDCQHNFSKDRKRSNVRKRQNKLFPENIPGSFRCFSRFNSLERVSQLFAVIILGLFPLLVDRSLYRHLTKAKFNYFIVIHIVYFGLVLILCFLLKSKFKLKTGSGPSTNFEPEIESRTETGSEPESNPKPESKLKKIIRDKNISLSQILCIVYMIWACISGLFSEYGSDVLLGQSRYEGLCTLLIYGTAFLLLSQWGAYSHHYNHALSIYAILESLLCLVQLFSDSMPPSFSFWQTGFLGTLGNVDCVAGINALVIPTLTVASMVTENCWRVPELVGVFLLSYIQMFAGADSGFLGMFVSFTVIFPFLCEDNNRLSKALDSWGVMFLGLACGSIFPFSEPGKITVSSSLTGTVLLVASVLMLVSAHILAVFSREPITEKHKVQRRKAAAFAVIIAIAVSVLFLYFYRGSHPHLHDVHELLHGRLEDHAGSDRGLIWKYCLELITQRPVFGYGPGTFISAFQPYNDYLHSVGFLKTIDFAHNDFLQIAVCEGITGLAFYVSFIASLCMKAAGKAGKSPQILIFFSGMIGYIAHSFVSFSIVIVTPGFWVMAGLMDRLTKQ